jgi:hypothetical protein
MSMKPTGAFLILALSVFAFAGSGIAGGQVTPPPVAPGTVQPSAGGAPLTALVDQLVDQFPKVAGEVIEVRGDTLTLDKGQKDGVLPGLDLEVYREGREIKHPKTGDILGRTEEPLGRTRIVSVQNAFSEATTTSTGIKPGDRYRAPSAKVNLVLLPLLGGVREGLVEAAIQELVERLGATGRFRVSMGDPINVHLTQEGIKAEEFLQGKGVQQAAQKFKVENLLAIYFKRVQNKPFMEVRFFTLPRLDPAISSAFFVPPSIRSAAAPGGKFSSGGGPANPPQAKQRSLLARLLGGDLEAGSYSSGEGTIPLRQVARFNFPVLAMDVAIAPADRIPRMVVSDGDQIYMYKIIDQRMEPEWSKSVRFLGRTISVQLADIDGDGVLEVVGNRYNEKVGLNSFVLGYKNGKPTVLVDNVDDFLFAVDLKGDGVKQTLWTQRYSSTAFFTPGQAEQVILKKGKLIVEKAVRVPPAFRPMGAAFCNITGKDTRSLAFVDEYNRLQISTEGEELWRSATSVGGGYMEVEQVYTHSSRNALTKFYKIEPTPLAVDLDGDGVEELIIPQNQVKEGLVAVVFKGPAGFRLQSVNTGFEGGITALGAFKTSDATQPTLVASVVRFTNFLKTSGETQIIMTVPQD